MNTGDAVLAIILILVWSGVMYYIGHMFGKDRGYKQGYIHGHGHGLTLGKDMLSTYRRVMLDEPDEDAGLRYAGWDESDYRLEQELRAREREYRESMGDAHE